MASALFDSLMASGEGGTTKISETTGRTTMKSLFDVNLNGGTKSEKKFYITYLYITDLNPEEAEF